MNYITTSKGERITRSTFDRRIREAKRKKLDQFELEIGYLCCEDCNRNEQASGKLDCSHEISVDKCIKNGKPELAYDIENIKLRCRSCHQKKDKTDVQWTK